MLRSQAAAANRADTNAAPADAAAPRPGRKSMPTAATARAAGSAPQAAPGSRLAEQKDPSTVQAIAQKTELARQRPTASPLPRPLEDTMAATDASLGDKLEDKDAAVGPGGRVEVEVAAQDSGLASAAPVLNKALPLLLPGAALHSGAQAAAGRDSEPGGSPPDAVFSASASLAGSQAGSRTGSPLVISSLGHGRFDLADFGPRETGTSPARLALSTSTDAIRAGSAPAADGARDKAVALDIAQANSLTSNSEASFKRSDDRLGETALGLAAVSSAPLQASAAAPAWAAANANPTTGASPSSDAQVLASPGTPTFGAETSAQISFFARQGVDHARLHLNPADMGPVTVQIQLDGLAATVNLTAEHAGTRAALESALPQLAGSLREAGLTLSGGGVFDRSPGQSTPSNGSDPGQARNGSDRGGPARGDLESGNPQRVATVQVAQRRRGVVDLIA